MFVAFVDRYFLVPPGEVLKDVGKLTSDILKKKQEIDSFAELKAVGNSEIHSTDISDPTSKAADAIIRLKDEMRTLEAMRDAIQDAYRMLDEEQKELLDVFYFSKGLVSDNIALYGKKYGQSTRNVYRLKEYALNDFRNNLKEILDAI